MNDPRIDPDTAERMLRGEPTGPPELAGLLAAASAELSTEDLNGEEAAVAAFRRTRSLHSPRPNTRRRSALVSVKAALIGLLLILVGGVTAMAATSPHLPGPLGNDHPHSSRTPETSQTTVTRTPPRMPSRRAPEPHDKHPKKPAQPKKHPHSTKKQKGDHPESNPHEAGGPAGATPRNS